SFTSVAGKLVVVSTTQITYQFNDASDAGTWTVQVHNPDGQTSSTVPFTVNAAVLPPPSISNVSPGSYPASNSDQPMTINGSGFQTGATLTFVDKEGGIFTSVAGKLVVVSTTQITYQFNDASDAGTWTVQVHNPDGQTSSTVPFTVNAAVLPPPSISNVSPGSYPASNSDQPMTINGSGFQTGATLTFVDKEGGIFTSVAGKLVVVSTTQITYQFNDASDAGTWTVQVHNPDGQTSSTVPFTVNAAVLPPPSISNVSPGSYPASNSDQPMTINGSGFQTGATLTFVDKEGGIFTSVAGKLVVVSTTQITYQFNDASDAGTWTVQVHNPDGQTSSTVPFTINAAVLPPPSISNVSSGSYPASNSDQPMTINGSGFQTGATLTFVDKEGGIFTSVAGKLVVVSTTQIT